MIDIKESLDAIQKNEVLKKKLKEAEKQTDFKQLNKELGDRIPNFLSGESEYYFKQLTKEELTIFKAAYKEWRGVKDADGLEAVKEKSEIYHKLYNDFYQIGKDRYWDSLKGNPKKIKTAAKEYIENLSYSIFAFQHLLDGMLFAMTRDFPIQLKVAGIDTSEMQEEQLQRLKEKYEDTSTLAESTILARLDTYLQAFLEASTKSKEEALKEWNDFIDRYIQAKVKEWVKTAESIADRYQEKHNKGKGLPEIAEEILQEKAVPGLNFYITNDKVTNKFTTIESQLFHLKPSDQLTYLMAEQEVRVSGENAAKDVFCIVSLQANTADGTLPRELKDINGYDMAVHRAICTAWKEKRYILTVVDIYQIMKDTDARPTKREENRIIKSLRKFLVRRLELNIAQENGSTIKNKKKFAEKADSGTLRDFMINYRELEKYTQRGERIFTIELAFEPILLVYAGLKGQVLQIPKFLYNTGMLMQTEAVMCIQEPLVKRLWLMKNGTLNNDTIKLETILSEGGIDTKNITSKQRESYLKTFKDLLKLYQSNKMQGFITGYEPIREGTGGKLTGYKITMDKSIRDTQKEKKALPKEKSEK